jgi:hypothetical protein
MVAGVTTIIAAGLAVLGTLLSPIFAQRVTARAKLQEFELGHRQRQEYRGASEQRLAFVERRTAYTELNNQLRAFHRALLNYMHLIEDGTQTGTDLEQLDDARRSYLNRYFDSQMLVSDDVLKAAGIANDGLGRAYGMARRLGSPGSPAAISLGYDEPAETVDSTFAYLEKARQRIANTRNIMRAELGLTSTPSPQLPPSDP